MWNGTKMKHVKYAFCDFILTELVDHEKILAIFKEIYKNHQK